ncbi:MAG: hypothetical protein LBT09_01480 [Planctomycetaceae bacterium]|jgi:hypothetical protein|nr:hypothetical protein [Planctomycetaceae bacterium]
MNAGGTTALLHKKGTEYMGTAKSKFHMYPDLFVLPVLIGQIEKEIIKRLTIAQQKHFVVKNENEPREMGSKYSKEKHEKIPVITKHFFAKYRNENNTEPKITATKAATNPKHNRFEFTRRPLLYAETPPTLRSATRKLQASLISKDTTICEVSGDFPHITPPPHLYMECG